MEGYSLIDHLSKVSVLNLSCFCDSGGQSSVFHSALILSLFGLMQDVVEVPEQQRTQTLEFLIAQKQDGHYPGTRFLFLLLLLLFFYFILFFC